MSRKLLRYRSFAANNLVLLVAVMLVVGAVGGWLTVTAYHDPGVTTTEQTVTTWETTGEFTHAATVTEPNPVYETGTTLPNRSDYFTTIAPNLDGNYTFAYTARESGNLSGRIAVVAVLRSVSDNGESSSVLWEISQPLNSTNVEGLRSGEHVTIPYSVDMAALENESTEIQESLGTTRGELQVELVATVTYDGTVNGRPVSDRLQHQLPMRYQGTIYQVANPGPQSEEYTTTRQERTTRTYGPLHHLGGPPLLLLSLVGLGMLSVNYRRGDFDISRRERELLAYYDARADYDEWITQMELPDEYLTQPRATAASLEGLVNYAIDSDEGVVEDPDRDLFAVVTDERCHVYKPPAFSTDSGHHPEDDGTSTESGDTEVDTAQDEGSPQADAAVDGPSPEEIGSEPGSNGSDPQDVESQ